MKKLNLPCILTFCCLALVTGVAHAVLLGAAHKGPDGPSTLYEIDPQSGAATAIGPIGYERCSAMDFDASGTLYATCERSDGSDTHVLITIDRFTGAGTEVGPTGIEFFRGGNDASATMTDISFRPSDGVLYGWNFPSLDRPAGFFGGLSTISTATGAASLVGYATGVLADDGSALAFSPSNTLLYAAGEGPTGSTCTQGLGTPNCDDVLHLVDESTAAATLLATLAIPAAPAGVADDRDPRPNAMDFDLATGTLFASLVYGFGGTASSFLAQIEEITGNVVIVGQSVPGLDALAFLSTPICDIRLDREFYTDGDAVTANVFRFANPTSTSIATEIKVWLDGPGTSPISALNTGSDGRLVLRSGVDFDFGPISLFNVTAGLPRGSYEWNCRFLDPVTGELIEEELNPFSIVTAQNETPTMATRYFPLAVGNIWQYFETIDERDGNPYTEYTYWNSNKIVAFNNSAVYNVKIDISTPDDENENSFYSKWDDGIYFHGVSDPDADDQGFSLSLTYRPPELFLKSTFGVGDAWSTTSEADLAVDGNVVATDTVTSNYSVMAIEDVTVPAGTFQNCYKISVDISSTNPDRNEIKTVWFAENVGIVKVVTSTIDSDVTQELQYSNIGGTVYGQEVVN